MSQSNTVLSPHSNNHLNAPQHNPRNTSRNNKRNINILQLNIDGIRNKHLELKHFLHKHKIHIAIIQETKLRHTHKTPNIPNFTAIRQDRQHGEGGGLITYIHHNLSYIEKTQHIRTITQVDRHTELQAFNIKTGHNKHITIINTYIPPEHSPGLPANYMIRLQALNTLPNILLGGDFNAKHTDWYIHQDSTQRGRDICTQLDQLYILNNTNSHTHIPHQANFSLTSPDITLCSSNIAPSLTWKTETDLSSDHLPIIMTLRTTSDTFSHTRHTIPNYKRSAWDEFLEYTEAQFQELNNTIITSPQTLNNITTHFNNIINNADKRYVPKGNRKHYNPNFSPDIKRLIRERNNLRDSPTPHTQITTNRIHELNTEINNKLTEKQTENWLAFQETLNFKTNPSKLHRTINSLINSNSGITQSHASITTSDRIPTRKQQANILIDHYAKISHLPKHKEDRHIHRRKHEFPLNHNITLATTEDTKRIIKKLKNSSAMGIDNISNIHLKHLGPHGIQTLTNIINYSYAHCIIPHIWKIGKIIALLKPNKIATEPASYRPITLLCTPSKVLERLILNKTTPYIPLSPTQHGYRPNHSTTTLLTNLTQKVQDGINSRRPPHRTLLITIDISKAFDAIPRPLLINKIYNTTLHNNTKRWLANYLSGRQSYVHYNGESSTTKNFPNGVPQGSVLSPTLFNLYMHDIPTPPDNIYISSYADDLTIISIHTDADICSTQVQAYITQFEQWLTQNRLKVAPSKSTSTLLTSHNKEHQHRPTATLNNTLIPHTHETKILGVTYNTSMSFAPHINNITIKCRPRLNTLRALTGSTFGQNKETLTIVFKQYIRSIIDYASPAWHPAISLTQINKLQTIQNTALRIILGSTQTTPIEHLHAETKILTIKQHLDMRGTQFLASVINNTDSPCHYLHNHPPTHRQIANTPHRHYSNILNTMPQPANISHYKKHIHTQLTRQALNNQPHNKILNTPPPDISSTETQLSRSERVHLTRLRCGHHQSLYTYKHRIDNTHTDLCPLCQVSPHTVTHLIVDCPNLAAIRQQHNITTTQQLWSDPVDVVHFLRGAGFLE